MSGVAVCPGVNFCGARHTAAAPLAKITFRVYRFPPPPDARVRNINNNINIVILII